jgi:predicted HTH transcriptional regulator
LTSDRPADYLVSLVHELCALPRETEWVEFKQNDAEPQTVGEYLSALANSAALVGKAFAYLVWGVRDADHAVVGTSFDPRAGRVGNEELESWLLRLLEPKLDFRFFSVNVDGHRVVLLQIARAARHRADRVRACYLHACLRYVTRQAMTNASLRQRLGIDDKNIASASRILGEAVDAGLIVIADPAAGTRIRSYLPFWAGPRQAVGEVV